MAIWTKVLGVIDLEEITDATEDQLLSIYEHVSHFLKGMNISFQRTKTQGRVSSASSDYTVEPYTRLSSMIMKGNFRHEDNVEEVVEALHDYTESLIEHFSIKYATFFVVSDLSSKIYTLQIVNGAMIKN